MLGTFVLRASSYEEYYGRAMKVRTLIKRDYQAAFGQCDLIASPTSPVPGFRIGERIADPLSMYLSDVFTIGANLAGLPGISIPGGFSSAAKPLPIGLQLGGPTLGESLLFSAAAAYEAILRASDAVGESRGLPQLDLVLLGSGVDDDLSVFTELGDIVSGGCIGSGCGDAVSAHRCARLGLWWSRFVRRGSSASPSGCQAASKGFVKTRHLVHTTST